MNYAYGTAIGEFAVEGFYFPLLGKPLSNFQYIGDGDGSAHKIWWKSTPMFYVFFTP